MNLRKILSDLEKERRRIDRAIAAMKKLGPKRKLRKSPRKKMQALPTRTVAGKEGKKATVLRFPARRRPAS